jgi:hypothetical protein
MAFEYMNNNNVGDFRQDSACVPQGQGQHQTEESHIVYNV